MNKLFKSRKDRILCGVCAGVGEYFGFLGITPDMVRMLTIIFAIFFPITFLIIYILMCIFVEDEP